MVERGRQDDLYFCFTHMGIPCQVEHVYLRKLAWRFEKLFYFIIAIYTHLRSWLRRELSNYVMLKYKIRIVFTFNISAAIHKNIFNNEPLQNCYIYVTKRERERQRRKEEEAKQRRKRKRRRRHESRRLYRPGIPCGARGKESKAVEFPLFPVSGPRGPYGVSRGGQYLHITTSWRGDHRR